MAQQPPTAGGLGQMRPQPAPKQENLAARAAGMEQVDEEVEAAPDDFMQKTMRDLQTQRQALNSQTQKLLESLDSRQNRMFDPVLMRAAAGFAKPTKTGSFGESLGYAAEGVADEAEKEFARNQVTQKLKSELMQKQVEQAQQAAIRQHRMQRFSPEGVPTQAGPAMRMDTPTGGAAQRTPGVPQAAQDGAQPVDAQAPMAQAQQPVLRTGAPRTQRLLTDRDLAEANDIDPSGKYAKEIMELMKLQQDDITNIGDTPYSRSRQQFLEANPSKIVEVDFGPFIDGPKKVPYSVYKEWLATQSKNDRNAELEFFYKKGFLRRPLGQPDASKPADGKPTDGKPVDGKPTAGGPPSVQETAAEKKLREQKEEEQRKADTERKTEAVKLELKNDAERFLKIDSNFENSREMINTAKSMNALATSNSRAFDLMNDEGVALAVARAAKAGIQAGQFGSISIPTDVLYQGVKLRKEDREALQLFARDYANLTVQYRKAARVPGEGATTEREGDLYAALGALPSDTARVIRMKTEFIEMRGVFDQQVFRSFDAFRKANPDGTYRQFLASDSLQDLKNSYDKRLFEVQKANSDLLSRKPPVAQQPATKPPAAQAPDAKPPAPAQSPAQAPAPSAGPPPQVGTPRYNALPAGGLFQDSDGTIKRKK